MTHGYQPVELLAVMWDADMAARFPDADHSECRCIVDIHSGAMLRCIGWHCNRCGAPTPSHGHRNDCPDRPAPSIPDEFSP